MGEPGAEALSGRALEAYPDGVLGQAGMAVALGDLAGQHGAGGAIDILDRQVQLDRLLVLDRLAAHFDELVVEHLVEAVVLALGVVDGDVVRHLGLVEQLGEVEASSPSNGRWPCSLSSTSVWPIISAKVRKPSAAMYSRTSSAT